MPQFLVTFEDVAFCSPAADDEVELELTEAELGGFNDTSVAEKTFPEGVLAVRKCTATPDDSVHKKGRDSDGDVKLFVSIDLLVEAEDLDEAYEFEPPVALLAKLADMLSDDLDLEGEWDNNGADPVDAAPAPAAI